MQVEPGEGRCGMKCTCPSPAIPMLPHRNGDLSPAGRGRGYRSHPFVWTPRRVLLLLGGILLFGGVYGFYARFLGWMDGLPQLPGQFLQAHDDPNARLPEVRAVSPTIKRICEAFGPDCLEQRSAHYPTQLEFPSPDKSSTVLACGSPPFNNGSTRIALAPFSIATFGAPKPEHLRQPGEAPEINTFHADKAILEFDRPVNGPADMAKAKLLRMELISEPDPVRLRLDRRCGVIHITNNQRSTDPAKFLVVRSVGPLFYRDPKFVDPRTSPGPDIWTDAAIEIVDRQNLPRTAAAVKPAYRTFSIAETAETVAAKATDLQTSGAVMAVLGGQRLPPPTATAIGLKVYLDPPNQAKSGAKKNGSTLSGVKRVELLEKVLLNLWVDAKQGLLTTSGGAKAGPLPAPPDAAGAALGGSFHGVETIRRLDRALLQVDTLGRLAYETDRTTARFDVVPDGNPDLPNDVQVHRVPPLGDGLQRLYSQVLEIEFQGSPVGAEANKTTKANTDGPAFKQLRAWTETPGRFVTLTSALDRLEAYGQYLQHDKATETTSLRGLPLYAVRTNEPRPDGKNPGSNVLTAGTKEQAAILTLKPGPGPERTTTATVEGPGRLELFDAAANANTIHAAWLTRMSVTREKDVVNRRELDLFTFIDGAKFEDERAEFWLKGKELRLWMEPKDKVTDRAAGTGRMMPHRVQALGDVMSHSTDIEIERADTLNVMFRDGVAPLQVAPKLEAKAVVPAPPMGPPPPKSVLPPPAPEPAKPKPPMKLKARTVDTWMVRYPIPSAPMAKANGESMKYELDKARCEGAVEVHQDPAEPGPEKRGLDIRGQTLLVDSTPDGSVMTVTGADDPNPGQVHHDGMSIIGAKIVLDQLHNTADVEGRGSLVLPSNTNLGGTDLKRSSVVVIHWRDFMRFKGADRWTEFQGKVTAVQNESSVACHIMQVRLDRPVDFSRRKQPAPGKEGNPKIESVRCYPAPEDLRDEAKDAYWVTYLESTRDETGKMKEQRLVARELELTARAFEPGNKDPHQRVVAAGPGTLRILQSGLKDEAAPAAKPGAAKESDTKLTIVYFGGRMIARDFGSMYQDATFQDTIDLMHLPADHIDFAPDRYKLPPGSVRLTCAEKLIVSSHKRPGRPTVQRLDGFGNADIRSDEYDGWGETITSEGPTVTLRGGENTLARFRNRFNANSTSARVLVYNRITGKFDSTDSAGGTIESGPGR